MITKKCNKCGKVKLISEFHKHKLHKDGHNNRCKNCRIEEKKRYWEKNLERIRERDRTYRKNNPEKAINWQENNSEKIKGYRIIYYKNNIEKIKIKGFKRRELRRYFKSKLICKICKKEFEGRSYSKYCFDCKKEEVRRRTKLFDKKRTIKNRIKRVYVNKICKECGNRFKVSLKKSNYQKFCSKECNGKASSRNLRHKRRLLIGSVHNKVYLKDLIAKYNYRCGICGEIINPDLKREDKFSLTIDHILPISKGGSHTLDNLQMAHLICNSYKGNNI
ncbi:hypothetical protein ES708_30753 [subsurface metagenome]